MLRLAVLVLILGAACVQPSLPWRYSSGGQLQILSKGAPEVSVRINGHEAVRVACNGGAAIRPSEQGVPPLPWDLRVVDQSTGRTLLDQRITELPRWLLVQRDSAGVSSAPISGPFVPCP